MELSKFFIKGKLQFILWGDFFISVLAPKYSWSIREWKRAFRERREKL